MERIGSVLRKQELMQNETEFSNSPGAGEISFSAYGVKIRITADDPLLLSKIRKNVPLLIPSCVKFQKHTTADFHFYLRSPNGLYEFYNNDELVVSGGIDEKSFLNFFLSCLRLTVAEFADSRVFIHAGVVSWKGMAIVLPANSFCGKTTLVSELIKNGAIYYSDEYAVLDENGFIHPYPKMLSVRGIVDEHLQKEIPVEEFGGVIGTKEIPAGLVLFTKFEKNAIWNPEELTTSQGVMEILAHTIPIRHNPKFSLEVLNKTLSRAVILKSNRREVEITAKYVLHLIEKSFIKNSTH